MNWIMKLYKSNIGIYSVLVFFFIYSCTFTYKRLDSSDEDKLYQKINSLGKRFSASVMLLNGNKYFTNNIIVNDDSTSLTISNTDDRIVVKTSDIHSIVFKDHFKGAIGGMTIGLMIGIPISITALTVDPPHGESQFAQGMLYLISGTVISSLLGIILGGIKSEKNIFIINDNHK